MCDESESLQEIFFRNLKWALWEPCERESLEIDFWGNGIFRNKVFDAYVDSFVCGSQATRSWENPRG